MMDLFLISRKFLKFKREIEAYRERVKEYEIRIETVINEKIDSDPEVIRLKQLKQILESIRQATFEKFFFLLFLVA